MLSVPIPIVFVPTLQDAALASLKSLNKNDVVEVRAMMRPPDGVRMVIEAVCIMKNIKPKKVAGAMVSMITGRHHWNGLL